MRSLVWLVIAGCSGGGSGGGSDGGGYYLAGECDPAAGTVPITTTAAFLASSSCLQSTNQLEVVESVAQWDALFSCPTDVPTGVDLTAGRAAIAHEQCTPLSLRFVSESDAEVVVGVVAGISGACIGEPVVVPLARSAKPVRLAQCREQCDDCPPVP